MIQTASCSISALFNGKVESKQEDGALVMFEGRLNVPEYQRPYLWGKKETDRILKDIKAHFKEDSVTGPDYYLGSIILHQSGEELNIIDGQQRLTTIALLLSAIDRSGNLVIDYSSPSTTQHIRVNYRYLQTRADEFRPYYAHIMERVNITLVVTDREDDAYTFFETQNTGGVRLSGVDIIKAFHLRAIKDRVPRNQSAANWEKQSKLEAVCTMVLKARYWKSFGGHGAPSRNNDIALKNAIVDEFSERTREDGLADVGYVVARVRVTQDGMQTITPKFPFAIRQPLNNGENLIDYMTSFCNLYREVLPYRKEGNWTDQSYESFINFVVKHVDGTLFLKELFEISLLCYAHRFGTEHLYEAALWLFRCTYELRLKNPKTVKETSVPDFLKKYPVIDIILSVFDHRELMEELRSFRAKVHEDNLEGNTVKCRYLKRLTEFFGTSFHLEAGAIDTLLIKSINSIVIPS